LLKGTHNLAVSGFRLPFSYPLCRRFASPKQLIYHAKASRTTTRTSVSLINWSFYSDPLALLSDPLGDRPEPKLTQQDDANPAKKSLTASNNPWRSFVPDPEPQFSKVPEDTSEDSMTKGSNHNDDKTDDDDDEEEEGFSYQPSDSFAGSNRESSPMAISTPTPQDRSGDGVESTSLGLSLTPTTPTAAFPTPVSSAYLGRASSSTPERLSSSRGPSSSSAVDAPSLYKSITEACVSGSLSTLRALFRPDPLPSNYPSAFTLSNTPHPKTGYTPLQYAASRGHLDIARHLVDECGALVDMVDPSGDTALHKAAYKGHAALVRFLCERGGGKVAAEEEDSDGWTPLHNAASRGWLDVVKILIEEVGASVDKRSKNGYTALMNASSKGHLPIVR
jgi:hypothetical protein